MNPRHAEMEQAVGELAAIYLDKTGTISFGLSRKLIKDGVPMLFIPGTDDLPGERDALPHDAPNDAGVAGSETFDPLDRRSHSIPRHPSAEYAPSLRVSTGGTNLCGAVDPKGAVLRYPSGMWAFLAITAWATDDVTLSSMAEHAGRNVNDDLDADLRSLYHDLGVMIAAPPTPAHTTGALGMSGDVGATLLLPDLRGESSPTAWERAVPDEDPGDFLYVPQINLRKGLPFSVEMDAHAAWIGRSRQSAFGGQIRVAVLEGWKPYPDVALRLGYSAYLGNPELGLGALEMGGTIGTKAPFGKTVKDATIAPFVDAVAIRVSANPHASSVDAAKEVLWTARITGGFEIVHGGVLLRLSGGIAPPRLPTVQMSGGFAF